MNRHAAAAALASLMLASTGHAIACGHCVEDRVAAVYDYGVVTRALDRHHRIAFFAIDGNMPEGMEWRRALIDALMSTSGMDAASLRVSVDSASMALSYDARRISIDRVAAVLNRKLAARRLTVSLLKVMGP